MRRRFLNLASIICCVACVALMGMWDAELLVRQLLGTDFGQLASLYSRISERTTEFRICRKAGVNAKVTALPLWRVMSLATRTGT